MLPLIVGGLASVVGGVVSTAAAAKSAGIPYTDALANVAASVHSTAVNSDEPGIRLWERRHGQRPANMVSSAKTPYPTASTGFLTSYNRLPATAPLPVPHFPPFARFQLNGSVEILSTLVEGGTLAGEVLALLLSLEGGREGTGSLRGHNPGNFKWSRARDAARPAFFLMDRIPSPGMYPAFANWQEGFTYWIRTLFGQRNFSGALPFAARGDIVGFTRSIGEGGYADSYRRDARVMIPRYIDRVKAGALAGEIIRQGKLDGFRLDATGKVEKLSAGRWVRA